MDVEAWAPGDSSPIYRTNLQFTKDALSHTCTVIVPEDKTVSFRGKETFRRIGELDFTRTVPAIPAAVHRIMNPFGQSWTMEVRAISSWTETEALFGEFRVWDVLRKTWLLAEHQFKKDGPTFTLRFSTSLETPRKAEARVTRIGADGKIVRGPWKDLAGPVAPITDDVKPQRRIRATLSAPHFQQVGVKKAFVDLEYHDNEHNIHETATPPLELARNEAVADWVHTFPDPSRPFYRFKVRARGEGGERYSGAWTESGADDLTITLPENPWAADVG
jgi:hypothetical protein